MYGLRVMCLYALSLLYKPEKVRLLWCFTPAKNSMLWAAAKI